MDKISKSRETFWGLVEEGDIVDVAGSPVVILSIRQLQPTEMRPYRHSVITSRSDIKNPDGVVTSMVKAQNDETVVLN